MFESFIDLLLDFFFRFIYRKKSEYNNKYKNLSYSDVNAHIRNYRETNTWSRICSGDCSAREIMDYWQFAKYHDDVIFITQMIMSRSAHLLSLKQKSKLFNYYLYLGYREDLHPKAIAFTIINSERNFNLKKAKSFLRYTRHNFTVYNLIIKAKLPQKDLDKLKLYYSKRKG
jgi:hypothetical protein